MQSQSRSIRRITGVVAVLFALLTGGAAWGQALPFLPDPIDTHTLMRYADRMNLSDQQRIALEPIHDAYLERIRTLRDTKIQDFQDSIMDVGFRYASGNMTLTLPERSEVEHIVNEHGALLDRLRRIDRELFDQMQGIMSEDQLPGLERVRDLRNLDFYWLISEGIGEEMNPGAGILLTEFVDELDLDGDVLVAIEERLMRYERSLLRARRAMYDEVKKAIDIALDSVDEWDLRDKTLEELAPIVMDEEFQEQVIQRFDEASGPLQSAAADVSKLNLRTYRAVAALVPEEKQLQFRRRFYMSGYSRVYDGPGSWRDRFEGALQNDDIPREVRERIAADRDRYVQQEDTLDDELVDTLEASRLFRTARMMDGDEPNPKRERLDGLQADRRRLREQADEHLNAIVAPYGVEAVVTESTELGVIRRIEGTEAQVVVTESSSGVEVEVAIAEAQAAAVAAAEAAGEMPKRNDLPPPIAAARFRQYTKAAGLTDDERTIAATSFDAYREAYDALLVLDVEIAGEDVPDPYTQLGTLEDELFGDVGLLTANESALAMLDRFRLQRQRQRDAKLVEKTIGWRMSTEADVDLVELLAETDGATARLESLAPLLDEYAESITPVREEQRAVALAAKRRQQAMMKARGKEGRAAQAIVQKMEEKYAESMGQLRKMGRRIRQANRRHLDDFADALAAHEAADLRYRYMRAAHPREFRDAKTIEGVLEQAMDVEGLTMDQRDQLAEVSMGFRNAYFDYTQEMVELRADWEWWEGGGPDRSMIEREIMRERRRFHRNEIASRTLMRTRLVLTDMQEAMIPDLDRWEPTSEWD